MDCRDVRTQMLDYQRGRLGPELQAGIRAHLAGCPACADAEVAERALTEVLERRLPQHPASLALKRRLAERWPAPAEARPSWWVRWGRSFAPAAAVAAVLLLGLPVYYELGPARQGNGAAGMVAEAVNDHVRVLQSEHPLEVESSNFHQVKPWLTARLDFAPAVSFLGDQEFPLRGGAVGYFLDRKAAVFVYGRRLHTISLFVFRAEGLPWPTRGLQPIGRGQATLRAARGYNLVMWQAGGLGYALVSDVDARDLRELAAKLAG
ncbi:MAG TPA: zf-HC2 domain-containing protein [Candidatus Sulfotelmatobacter sp.]|nr:zf-HC2 domain-containing protein [Candidatus Sulfotelmatobacter sp.]